MRVLCAGVLGHERDTSLDEALIAVSNTTVVNTETMCQLPRKIAALGLAWTIT